LSANNYASLVAPVRESAAHAAWTQWGALAFGAAAKAPARAIVDPEALVLATLVLEEHEVRLRRLVQMWIGAGSRLLSSGRLANLLRDYPDSVMRKVAPFAAEVVAAGDARFRRLAGQAKARVGKRSVVVAATPDLRQPSTLMLRMRLALGVGIKADALTFLLGRVGVRATVREVASGTGYFARAVRRALDDLVAARLVEVQATSPISYSANWAKFQQLLGVDQNNAPLWRSWHELYRVALALDGWGREADAAGWTLYVAASRLRDVFEHLAPVRARAYVQEAPDWERPPEEWIGGEWLAGLADRLRGVL
jgi:hypothetical protein